MKYKHYVFTDGTVCHVAGGWSKAQIVAHEKLHGPLMSSPKTWTTCDHMAASVLRKVNEMEETNG
jgi:hypothetical protein